MFILSILFFITAILYSSVGFGGGSTYLALLLIWDVPYYIFPVLALICNIIVVSGNSINYIRAGNLDLKILIPYLIGSIPFAFIGGSISLDKEVFEIILFLVLSIAGFLLLINSNSYKETELKIRQIPKYISIIIGSILGIAVWYSWNWWWNFFKPYSFFTKSWLSKADSYNSFVIYSYKFDIWSFWSIHKTKRIR
jgi:uncharacterized membrane protein YfcA